MAPRRNPGARPDHALAPDQRLRRLHNAGRAATPDPAGPALSKAMLAVLVQRLDQADDALARGHSAAPDPGELADATALTGDVLLQRGQPDRAARLFAQADGMVGTSGTGRRSAMLTAGRGDRAKEAALFPEAVAHHWADHELLVGNPAKALALAGADAAARPRAPNLVLLARALLAAGRLREALAVLDRADAQGWISAAQHMTRAEVGAALGDNAEREAALAKALAISPRVAHPRAELIWFGFD